MAILKSNSEKLHSSTKFGASVVKCPVVVNSLFLTAAFKGHNVVGEWQIDKVMKWGTIHLLLPMELPLVDGTKAVMEIRGPDFVTCVWLCLGSPCFNKHLDTERGPAYPKCSAFAQMHRPNGCACRKHTAHVFGVCVELCFCEAHPHQVSYRCILLCRSAMAGWYFGLAPDLLPWHRNPLKAV